MTEPLTDRQEKILAFIKKSIQEQGYPPTIREIGEHFGIRSTNGVNDHLKALERKGYLLRGELKSRALSVIEGGKPARFVRREIDPAPEADSGRVVEVPVVGKVASGAPDRGRNSGQLRTGCLGYFSGSNGQRMNVLVPVRTYRGGAAQRWHKLSGNGRSSLTRLEAYLVADRGGPDAFSANR